MFQREIFRRQPGSSQSDAVVHCPGEDRYGDLWGVFHDWRPWPQSAPRVQKSTWSCPALQVRLITPRGAIPWGRGERLRQHEGAAIHPWARIYTKDSRFYSHGVHSPDVSLFNRKLPYVAASSPRVVQTPNFEELCSIPARGRSACSTLPGVGEIYYYYYYKE